MHPPIKDEQKKDFTDRLFVAECTLLRVVDFKLDLDQTSQLKEYVHRYARTLYQGVIGVEPTENIVKFGEAIANDSFFTYANILYSVQTVALASVFVASARYAHPLPIGADYKQFAKGFDAFFLMYKTRSIRKGTIDEDKIKAEFDQLPWPSRIDERIDPSDLELCIKMITEFYAEQAQAAFEKQN